MTHAPLIPIPSSVIDGVIFVVAAIGLIAAAIRLRSDFRAPPRFAESPAATERPKGH